MATFDELLEQLQTLLDGSVQNWLFGAGISVESNIPLMYPLTERIRALVMDGKDEFAKQIYTALVEDLPGDSHIEDMLSHIGDLIALADRSKEKQAQISGNNLSIDQLENLYRLLIKHIGTCIRYGYRPADTDKSQGELIGSPENPIVEVDNHRRFVRALFGGRANLERRSRISFFTTNYDTLLEDALSMEGKACVDGFTGGAVAYWNPDSEFSRSTGGDESVYRVVKLHGSVDWSRDESQKLLRNRYGVKYLPEPAQILIYPQATKYVETQKDPFATLFAEFRSALNHREDNILCVCGFSFGDSHINTEIRSALMGRTNRTTLIAFVREGDEGLAAPLSHWLGDRGVSSKIFVATERGLYNGSRDRHEPTGGDLSWWTFQGLTEFLENGAAL